MMWKALLGCAVAMLALCGDVLGQSAPRGAPSRKDRLPVGLCLIPETDYIPEVDDWPLCRPDAFPDEVTRALKDWEKKRRWVEKRITPQLVQALSGWARSEMKQYTSVTSLAKVQLKPVRHHEARRKIVLEGTIDTLPTHSRLVTRWLKIFLLYDRHTRRIIRATVTIRGQVLE